MAQDYFKLIMELLLDVKVDLFDELHFFVTRGGYSMSLYNRDLEPRTRTNP